MKTPPIILMGALALALGWAPIRGQAQSAYVQENESAFFASGSDGGLTRVHLIDKPSGQVRTGVVDAGTGSIAWDGSLASGVTGVTGAALWRTSAGTGVDLLALASPAHNRIERGPTASVEPGGYSMAGVVGPSVLAGLDPSLSTGTHFVVASVANGEPAPVVVSGFEVVNGVTGSVAIADEPRAANRVHLRTGAASRGALVFGGRVQVASLSGGPPAFGTSFAVSDPLTCRWTYGWFKNEVTEPRSQFIEFTPGETVFRLRQVTEPTAGNFSFAAAVEFSLGAPIDQVAALAIPGFPRLAVVFADGSAGVFDFNGVTAPVARVLYSAPPGGYRFGMPAAGGRLVLVTDSDWRVFQAGGASPSSLPLASGSLPALRAGGLAQNVFITQGEPLADPAAALVGGMTFDEWTSDAAGPNGQPRPLTVPVSLQTERFGGEAAGLVVASPSRVVGAQGPNRFLLPNQHAFDASVGSFGTSAQNVRADVVFSPAPGVYAPALPQSGESSGDPPAAVTVRLSSTDGAPLFYRSGTGAPWLPYDPSAPIAVGASMVIEARTATSPLRTGAYTVEAQSLSVPAAVDADLDGLADGWEQLFGQTDPNADPDGDGVNNLTEQNAGTDPLDPLSTPGIEPLENINLAAGSTPDGTTLTLTWPADIGPVVLQRADGLNAWEPVDPPAVGNSYSVPMTGQRAFFRLVRP